MTTPPGVELIVDLLNTHDREEGKDDWQTPDDLHAWLHERGLCERDEGFTTEDLRRLRAVREAIRDVLWAREHGERAERAAALLDREAARCPLRVGVGPDGASRLVPAGEGADAVAAAVLAAIAVSAADGSWDRVKVCHRDPCRWAFYDGSRNRSRTWCSMAVCGNRVKVASFRERHGAGPS